ncbi:antiviral reverse transcriptase Drt3b [Blastomonas sp.]|uniref:antiviral reverse transcriptase Drt3b n=1 Tax=Blastomonas sp. TaxID=1909299 RepID=UPI00261B6B84|nr:antiviral reverse transcriptase Drt3b [Blastomonas sp.]MDM7955928.1 antiviral reverse transcriptase Drt3b [Blastomonas sp.]
MTDMLPFEVPPTFTNRGFFAFLRDHKVEIEDGRVRWIDRGPGLERTIKLIFGVKKNVVVETTTQKEWGAVKPITRRSVPLKSCRMETIPFNFRVAHKIEGRTLSVVHPRNQVRIAEFYARHSAMITYYTSLSSFSIRRPVSVSRYAFFKDKLHDQDLESISGGVEEYGREYEQIGSYFVYQKYRNIHKFFESYKYHRCEKKYDAMMQIDISKCFDSIYTHSMPWAVMGKNQTKFNLDGSKSTFGGRFDAVMQQLNQNETNGIVIGPEFSRIFAEIILQSVDVELERALFDRANLKHKSHYEIFRYVDDFFVFYNDKSTELHVIEELQEILKSKKLAINPAKLKVYPKPIITEITIAKEHISTLMNSVIDPSVEETDNSDTGGEIVKRFSCNLNANRLIVGYKTVIKESKVEYSDLLNYTFAIIENKVDIIIGAYLASDGDHIDRRRMVNAIIALLEFSFFAYSASPKVNHTIRMCRMVATAVGFLTSRQFPHELKHLLFKFVHDNIREMLAKNKMSSHREIESLYLLIVLSGIGREYWLPEEAVASHFLIKWDEKSGVYLREKFLNHFSITVLLSYVKNKVRYAKLRAFIEAQALAKLDFVKTHCPNDAEALMLFLDLVVCPYVSVATQNSAGAIFGLDAAQLAELQAVNSHWFTAWGDKFDLTKELDAKRSRDVY